MSLMTETCTLVLAGGPTGEYDRYGEPVIGPPRRESWPCWFEPRTSGEDVRAADQQTDGYWLYLPLGAPLTSADSVVLPVGEYEAVGEPAYQPGGFLVEGFLKTALERVRG